MTSGEDAMTKMLFQELLNRNEQTRTSSESSRGILVLSFRSFDIPSSSSFSSQPISPKDEHADIAIVKQGHIMQRRTALNVCERCGRRHARSQKCLVSDSDRHVNEISMINVIDRSYYLNTVNVVEICNMVPTMLVALSRVHCNMEFDTRASATVITEETWYHIGRLPVRPLSIAAIRSTKKQIQKWNDYMVTTNRSSRNAANACSRDSTFGASRICSMKSIAPLYCWLPGLASTTKAPAELLCGHGIRKILDHIRPDMQRTSDSNRENQKERHDQGARQRNFEKGQKVYRIGILPDNDELGKSQETRFGLKNTEGKYESSLHTTEQQGYELALFQQTVEIRQVESLENSVKTVRNYSRYHVI
ncbi:hypothetical protein GJ496_004141 [Pomphorhynchus laevis]|nr:hypothetical protein GJ496_004141 [Pomphorhynchus laevis]